MRILEGASPGLMQCLQGSTLFPLSLAGGFHSCACETDASEAGRSREGESEASPGSGKRKLSWKRSAYVSVARTLSHVHLAVRDSVGEDLAGHTAVLEKPGFS